MRFEIGEFAGYRVTLYVTGTNYLFVNGVVKLDAAGHEFVVAEWHARMRGPANRQVQIVAQHGDDLLRFVMRENENAQLLTDNSVMWEAFPFSEIFVGWLKERIHQNLGALVDGAFKDIKGE